MSATSAKPRVIDSGLCRCCGATKKCRILTMEYEFLGQKEVYSHMIMDCFGLLLSHLDGKLTECLVCATCVVRLRAAAGFRRQVLRCEEAFLQMKLYDVDAVDALADTDMKPTVEVEVSMIKEEPAEAHSPVHSPAHSPHSPARSPEPIHSHTLGIGGGDSGDEAEAEVKPLASRRRRHTPATLARGPAGARRGRTARGGEVKPTTEKSKAAMSALQQQNRERDVTYLTETNILNVIEFSFALPFKCRHNNLLCYYCGELCADPAALRGHTETLHTPKRFKIVEHKKMVKVDLTRIDCRLCEERIGDLESFKKHIIKAHNKMYYFNYPDLILPFRLTEGELSCCLCATRFPYFHALNKHMNVHFSNYVCETCGLGFVDKCRFLMHQQRHESGCYPCPTCGKTFRAIYNRELHVDRVHNKKGRVYCPKCDIKLMSYPQKLKHLVEVHGEAPLSFPCGACERVFMTRRMLTIHRRKDHLKDYRYECQFCGQKFFTRFSLNNHTPTHTGERNFKCAICDKSYPRHKTLKDHMRIHTNDRRYRCHICGQAFIQNCSLKGHIKSQHPDKAVDMWI